MLQFEIIGRLGRDAEVRDSGAGHKYTKFSVAHTANRAGLNTDRENRTTWITCLMGGESGVTPYLKKGTPVFIRGDFLDIRTFVRDGSTQARMSCRVREIQLLSDGSGRTQQPAQPARPSNAQPVREPPYRTGLYGSQTNTTRPSYSQPTTATGPDGEDDDLPF